MLGCQSFQEQLKTIALWRNTLSSLLIFVSGFVLRNADHYLLMLQWFALFQGRVACLVVVVFVCGFEVSLLTHHLFYFQWLLQTRPRVSELWEDVVVSIVPEFSRDAFQQNIFSRVHDQFNYLLWTFFMRSYKHSEFCCILSLKQHWFFMKISKLWWGHTYSV